MFSLSINCQRGGGCLLSYYIYPGDIVLLLVLLYRKDAANDDSPYVLTIRQSQY